MVNMPLFTSFYTSHVVQDVFHQQFGISLDLLYVLSSSSNPTCCQEISEGLVHWIQTTKRHHAKKNDGFSSSFLQPFSYWLHKDWYVYKHIYIYVHKYTAIIYIYMYIHVQYLPCSNPPGQFVGSTETGGSTPSDLKVFTGVVGIASGSPSWATLARCCVDDIDSSCPKKQAI